MKNLSKLIIISLIIPFLSIFPACKTEPISKETIPITESTIVLDETTAEKSPEKTAETEQVPITELISYYLIQLELITDSDWTTLVTENAESIKTLKLENITGNLTKYAVNSKYLWLDQGIEAANQNKKVGFTINYAISKEAINQPINFVLYKGAINGTYINVYYLTQNGKELIQEIKHIGVVESSPDLNPKKFSIDLSSLVELESNEAEIKYEKNIPKMIWAFYYPWYTMDTADAWNSDVLVDKPTSPYESGDPSAIERHIDEAKSAGIDGFISSWWGPESLTDNNLKILLDVAEDKEFAISIIFETLSDYGPRDKQEIKDWLEYVIKNYGNHPAFAKVNGKPLIVIYETGSIALDIWKDIIEELEKEGNNAVFLGMGYNIYNLEVFDGIYEYGVFNIEDHLELYEATSSAVHYYQIFNNSEERKIFVATVQPGYDDRLIPGRKGTFKEREEGNFYKRTLDGAIKSNPDYIFITSWNEWFENTHIEPSINYGNKYLEITKEYSKKWKLQNSEHVSP